MVIWCNSMRYILSLVLLLSLIALASHTAGASAHTFSVSGRVLDGYGQAVEGANVTLIDTNGRAIAATQTNAEGVYSFKDIMADTDAIGVRVSHTHGNITYSTTPGDARWYQASGDVRISPELTRLDNYYPFGSGYLRGQVVRSDSLKKVNATVYVGNIVSMDTADGSFVFIIPPGTYDVYAVHDEPRGHFTSDTIRITVNETEGIQEAPPIELPVRREGLKLANPAAFVLSLIAGILCLIGMYLALKKY
jgi:hypothetical protein